MSNKEPLILYVEPDFGDCVVCLQQPQGEDGKTSNTWEEVCLTKDQCIELIQILNSKMLGVLNESK